MKHSKKLLSGVILLLIGALALGAIAGCCPAEEGTPTPTATPTAPAEETPTPAATEPPGDETPSLAEGDSWTYTVTWPGTSTVDPQESTFVATVASAGAGGYEVTFEFDETERVEKVSPLGLPVTWAPPMTRTYESDLDWAAMQTTINAEGYGELLLDMVVSVSPTESKWPLAEGSEWSETLDMDVGGLLQKTWELDAVVEAEEEVTVAAGTFNCYKIVKYDGDTAVVTEWFSDEVKAPVKRVEELFWRGGADTWELSDYSVAQ